MPTLAPLIITFYDPNTAERIEDFACNFVPLKQFKLAIGLASSKANVNQQTLAALLWDVFGRQFSADRMLGCTSTADRMQLLTAILQRGQMLLAGKSDDDDLIEEENLPIDENWLVDVEISLAKAYGWALKDIEETDIESLCPFIARIGKKNKVYIDQLDL